MFIQKFIFHFFLFTNMNNFFFFFFRILCLVSGEPTKDPVLSPKSGRIFERSLIESYISQNGTDPFSNDDLSADDLISIKTNGPIVPPRPPTLTSVPSLLSALQNQWDAVALETFSLRQQLTQTRQELSTALYYHDASVRVVARLMKERDEARESLAQLSASIGNLQPNSSYPSSTNGHSDTSHDTSSSTSDTTAESDSQIQQQQPPISLPQPIVQAISAKQKELSSTRRKRKAGPQWATLQEIVSLAAHEKPSKQFFQHAQSLSISPSISSTSSFEFLLSGGAASKAGIFNPYKPSHLNTLFSSSSGIITTSSWISDSLFALGTKSGQIELYSTEIPSEESAADPTTVAPGPVTLLSTIDLSSNTSGDSVISLKTHPVSSLLFSLTSSSTWAIHDVSDPSSPKTLASSTPLDSSIIYTTIDVHPDGNLVAIGTSQSSIDIYSLENGERLAQLVLPGAAAAAATSSSSTASVSALTFCENGYWLAASYNSSSNINNNTNGDAMDIDIESSSSDTVDLDGTAIIWDLRKLSITHTVPFPKLKELNRSSNKSRKSGPFTTIISRLVFDNSTQYLVAISGSTLSIVGFVKSKKSWTSNLPENDDLLLQLSQGDGDDDDNNSSQNKRSSLFTFSAPSGQKIEDIVWSKNRKAIHIVTQKGSFQTFSV